VDPVAAGAIGAVIGAPAEPAALVVPLAAAGRTASLIVGDFGPGPAVPPPLDLLETFAAQAGAALELFLARRRLDKAGTVIR
jgi:GAF domain-containing protein